MTANFESEMEILPCLRVTKENTVKNMDIGLCYQLMQTVLDIWPATTLDGIDIPVIMRLNEYFEDNHWWAGCDKHLRGG